MPTKRSPQQLHEDALAIWRAGVDAVASEQLVRHSIRVTEQWLEVGEDRFPLPGVGRIAVVGAGKAGAGMAEGLLDALAPLPETIPLEGWINVPEDCVRSLEHMPRGASIRLFGARPAGVNEPTEAGVQGTQCILNLVRDLSANDLCICLLSGGGSALLPAPADGISLADKQAITRFLSGAGADIWQLNTVRKQLSQVKGGGLARACRAGHLITLIISDVLGDPLDIIASGPTVANQSTPRQALDVLEQFQVPRGSFRAIYDWFSARVEINGDEESPRALPPSCNVVNRVIGNNALAVDAAGHEAERRGYSHAMHAAQQSEGEAEDVGRHLAAMAQKMQAEQARGTDQAETHPPDCLITGGEPTVHLAPPEERGKGGRNQQLVLAAFDALLASCTSRGNSPATAADLHVAGQATQGLVILSGGTDGEDGPTDAAGAILTHDVAQAAAKARLVPQAFLQRNDAYHFFEQTGGLLCTGATHTNVCDLRVVVVGDPSPSPSPSSSSSKE